MQDDLTFVRFSENLASKAPTPGGGGASAAVGALACALGEMVCNLTLGKEKYAQVEDRVQVLLDRLDAARTRLLDLVDEDAAGFAPLAAAYKIPRGDPSREERMNAALKGACEPPITIMEVLGEVIDLLAELGHVGSKLAITDVGVAAICAKAALEGASLNVFVNATACTDDDYAMYMENRAARLLREYGPRAQEIFEYIQIGLRR